GIHPIRIRRRSTGPPKAAAEVVDRREPASPPGSSARQAPCPSTLECRPTRTSHVEPTGDVRQCPRRRPLECAGDALPAAGEAQLERDGLTSSVVKRKGRSGPVESPRARCRRRLARDCCLYPRCNTISTRRLLARPSGVRLSATGRLLPNPTA